MKKYTTASILIILLIIFMNALGFAGQPEEFVTLDLDGVDLVTLIKYMSEATGRVILFDPTRVKGKVTIITPKKIPKAELWSLFQSVLEMQGYTTVSAGNMVKIVPTTEAKTKGIEVRRTEEGEEEETSLRSTTGLDSPAPSDRVITRVISLRYARAQDLAATLSSLVSPKGHIVAYPPTNALIITDYASNIARIVQLITGKEDVPKN